jgi:peptidyl-prolyl cis-trans isomerase A (cyclophilin A)
MKIQKTKSPQPRLHRLFASAYKVASAIAISAFIFAGSIQATVVEIRTNVGNIQVNLFDQTTPETVENFLEYVNSGAYSNNVVHRSVPDFVVQMGGFQYNGDFPADAIPTGPSVVNEPELSNVRGTLAMAKFSNAPNSATSQFFVNVEDNSANLDTNNGGFTVFGQVIGDGMDVVDAINALNRFGFNNTFAEVPLRDYTQTDIDNDVEPDASNLIIVSDIVVIDAAVNTNPNLNPTPNTRIDSVNNPSNPPSTDSSGGSLSFALVAGLFILSIRRRLL